MALLLTLIPFARKCTAIEMIATLYGTTAIILFSVIAIIIIIFWVSRFILDFVCVSDTKGPKDQWQLLHFFC